MKNLIHKTYKKNIESILENGFNIPNEAGRFGCGVYFMVEDSFGSFGDGAAIVCDIESEFVLDMTHDEIRSIYPYIDYQEGGEPKLELYVKEKGYKGVSVSYIDGEVEVVVYDTSIISIQEVIIEDVDVEAKDNCPVKSPLNWYGGKYYMRENLNVLFPPHLNYVEVFGGAGHVALYKPLAKGKNVYNDLNKGLYTFFKVAADEEKRSELLFSLSLTPYSQAEWEHCGDWELVEDEVEMARQFFTRVMQSRSNNGKSWAYARDSRRNMSTSVSRWLGNVDNNMVKCKDKLSNFEISNMDYKEVLNKYDSEDTLFYLDPPYVQDVRTYKEGYLHEMSVEDHMELVDALIEVDGYVVLSGYDNEVYRKLEEHGFYKILLKEVVKPSVNGNRLDKKGKEYVWVNYEVPENILKWNVLEEYFEPLNNLKKAKFFDLVNSDISCAKRLTKKRLKSFCLESNLELPIDYFEFLVKYNGGISKSNSFPMKMFYGVGLNSEAGVDLNKIKDEYSEFVENGFWPVGMDRFGNMVFIGVIDTTQDIIMIYNMDQDEVIFEIEDITFSEFLVGIFYEYRKYLMNSVIE